MGQKKPRWRLPGWEAMRIFAAVIAVGVLLFLFRGFYIEILRDRPLTVIGAAIAVVVLILVAQHYEWTGFGESVQPKPDEQEIRPRKTLWDWLQLLIVPVALAAVGFWFTAQQDARQQRIEDQRAQQAQKIENQRAKAERTIQQQNAQDKALQAYLDQMSTLLLEHDLRNSEAESEVRTLARARTVTVIQRLDADGNRNVIRFLREANLTGRGNFFQSTGQSSISLLAQADLQGAHFEGVDLTDIDLSVANLDGAHLRGAYLSGADLSGAHLSDASLDSAVLSSADLSSAVLSDADLSGANLSFADLNGARMSPADLSGAILSGAILDCASMRGATGITNEELDQQAASLEDATMRDGQKYEDWIKDRDGRKKDGEKSGSK